MRATTPSRPTGCSWPSAASRIPRGWAWRTSAWKTNARGQIEVDPGTFKTAVDGVYAVGDVVPGPDARAQGRGRGHRVRRGDRHRATATSTTTPSRRSSTPTPRSPASASAKNNSRSRASPTPRACSPSGQRPGPRDRPAPGHGQDALRRHDRPRAGRTHHRPVGRRPHRRVRHRDGLRRQQRRHRPHLPRPPHAETRPSKKPPSASRGGRFIYRGVGAPMDHRDITAAIEANAITLDEALTHYVMATTPETVAMTVPQWHPDAIARLPKWLEQWPTSDIGWSERWVCGSAHVSDTVNSVNRMQIRVVVETLRAGSF